MADKARQGCPRKITPHLLSCSRKPWPRARATWGIASANNNTKNFFGKNAALSWDYTMVWRVEGAALWLDTKFSYLKNPAEFAINTRPPKTIDPAKLRVLSGMPVFVEENSYFNNSRTDDPDPTNTYYGLFGGSRGTIAGDQLTTRHKGAGAAVMADPRELPSCSLTVAISTSQVKLDPHT